LGFPAKLIDPHAIDLRTGAESQTDLGEMGEERRRGGEKGKVESWRALEKDDGERRIQKSEHKEK
jgi:hypothetical protein